MVEPRAAIAQRAAKKDPIVCKNGVLSAKMIPEKMDWGVRIIGIKLEAGSLLGESAEMARPSIRPASEVRAMVIYISTKGDRKTPCAKGAFKFTTTTRMALCSRHNTPRTAIFENM